MNIHQAQARLAFDKPGRGRVYGSILETIGNTPLVRIIRLTPRGMRIPPRLTRMSGGGSGRSKI